MKCRSCGAPFKERFTTTTPTCPHCGAFWPGGLGALWVIATAMVVYFICRLWVG